MQVPCVVEVAWGKEGDVEAGDVCVSLAQLKAQRAEDDRPSSCNL